MKKALIIIAVFLILGVIAGIIYVANERRKKKVAEQRTVLAGKSESEFLDYIRPLWETKWKQAAIDYHKQDSTYLFAINDADKLNCPRIDPTHVNYPAFVNCVLPALTERVNNDWKTTKPKPLNIDWAKQYWLPEQVGLLGIDYNNPIVQQALQKI